MNLSGSIAVVTGASRGIGKAITLALEEAGVVVVGCARSAADGVEAVDVTDSAAFEAFIQRVQKEYGKIDILINNAGVAHDLNVLESLPVETYQTCMAANTDSVFYGMHAVLPIMKQQGSGYILNIASRAGQKAHPHLAAYCASKYAVMGLTHAVAKDLNESGSGVRCIAISPGGVCTDMRAELFGQEDAEAQQRPEDIANCVLSVLCGDVPTNNGDNIIVMDGSIVDTVAMP